MGGEHTVHMIMLSRDCDMVISGREMW